MTDKYVSSDGDGRKSASTSLPGPMPAKFSGGSDVNIWLNIFEDFAADYEWDDVRMARKIKLLLGGEAQICVWDMKDSSSYKAIKEVLLKQYGGSASRFRAMEAFHERQRRHTETLRELVFALKMLYMHARPEDKSDTRDREVKFKLLHLLDRPRESLLRDSDIDSSPLDTVVERASRLEQTTSKKMEASPTNIAVVDDRMERLEQRLEALTAAVSSDRRGGGRSAGARGGAGYRGFRRTGCFRCGGDGHIARNCQAGQSKPCRCYRCRGWGHTSAVCPTKPSGNF
jgi:hypothetical protein